MRHLQKIQSDRITCTIPAAGRRLLSAVLALLLLLLNCGMLMADNQVQQKDTDQDGKIDQTAFLDVEGRLDKLHIDSNRDGIEDVFQIYSKGDLVRIDRDTDFDGVIDTRDRLEKTKRVSQERLDREGRVVQVITFNARGQVSKVKTLSLIHI